MCESGRVSLSPSERAIQKLISQIEHNQSLREDVREAFLQDVQHWDVPGLNRLSAIVYFRGCEDETQGA